MGRSQGESFFQDLEDGVKGEQLPLRFKLTIGL